jgi:hypothetical protein
MSHTQLRPRIVANRGSYCRLYKKGLATPIQLRLALHRAIVITIANLGHLPTTAGRLEYAYLRASLRIPFSHRLEVPMVTHIP